MKRRAFGALGLTVLVALVTGCGDRSGETEVTPNINEVAPESSAQVYLPEGNHLSKSQNSKVTVVQFTDYQCSYCKAAAPELEGLTKKYAGRINIQVRNFPMESQHYNSRVAAQAAEAVRLEDSNLYLPFSQSMFESQEEWAPLDRAAVIDKFVGYAKELRIDERKFRESIDSDKVKEIVQRDIDDSESLKLPGTPIMYLNGERLNPGVSIDSLSDEIDSLLSK